MEYQQNINDIAKLFSDSSNIMKNNYNMENTFIPAAKIAVKLQADAIRAAFKDIYTRDGYTELYLLEHGLVDPTKCIECDGVLTMDNTGTYCDNHKCNKFWQTK